MLLRSLVPELPGAVHLAVVDPGVGTDRHAVAMALDNGSRVVGPDNGLLGLLVPVADAAVRLPSGSPRSATFHGRDVFAPIAARLARGDSLDSVGTSIPLSSVQIPSIPAPHVRADSVEALVVGADRFGNLALAAGAEDLDHAGLGVTESVSVAGNEGLLARTFGDVADSEILVFIDSNEMLSIAVGEGNAQEQLGIAVGETVRISRTADSRY